MRNQFLPMVETQFGENTSEKILYLSKTLESYKNILDKKVFEPFYSQMKKCNSGYQIDISEYLDMDSNFWHTVLTKIFHKMNLNMPSLKSVVNFINMIKKRSSGIVSINKSLYIYLDYSKSKLYILERSKIKLKNIEKGLNIRNIIY